MKNEPHLSQLTEIVETIDKKMHDSVDIYDRLCRHNPDGCLYCESSD